MGDEFGPDNGPPNPFGTGVLPNVWDYGLSVAAPQTYQDWGRVGCVAFDPNVTANCLSLGDNSRTVPSLTYTGRYFPAYYLLVGLPSRVTSPGARQIYAMRLVSVMLAAALLASAVMTTRRAEARWFAGTGVVLAITPTALFFAASVNPSGLEIAGAIAVWTTGTLVAKTAVDGIDRRVLDRLGIAAIALAVARPLGPLWLGIAGAILAVLAGSIGVRALWRSSRVRVWLLVIAATTAFHLGWNVWTQAYQSKHYIEAVSPLTISAIIRGTTGRGYELVQQMIGVFGWLDTPSPALTVIIWLLAIGALTGLALALAPRRWAIALGIIAVLIVLVPIVLEGLQARHLGLRWQGRYTLPLAVGLPVVAGFSLSYATVARFAQRRLRVLVIVGVTVAQVLAFGQALRRYAVGANGTVWFFTRSVWDPPIPSLVLVVGFAATTSLFLAYVLLPGGTSPTGRRSQPASGENDLNADRGSEVAAAQAVGYAS